jgi:hypothetical protein
METSHASLNVKAQSITLLLSDLKLSTAHETAAD